MLRNRLRARALPESGLTSDNVLERMLDPAVGIGTSTLVRDPGRDYTWMVFARVVMHIRSKQNCITTPSTIS